MQENGLHGFSCKDRRGRIDLHGSLSGQVPPGSVNGRHSARLIRSVSKILVTAALLAGMSGVHPARATSVGPGASVMSSCDPEFMDAIDARGYMEAQRQIEQNGNLILKEDSVLEYTCFDRLMSHLGNDASWGFRGPPFPDQGTLTSKACVITNQGPGALYGSLSNVVWSALQQYMWGMNGDPGIPGLHGYLSGRAGVASWSQFVSAPQANYNCSDMETVWRAAHCMNFIDEGKHDGFYDFYWYAIFDARRIWFVEPWLQPPPAIWNICGGANYGGTGTLPPAPNPNFVFNVTNDMDVAFNGMSINYSINPENPWSNQAAPMADTTNFVTNPVISYLNRILPIGTAPAPGNCAGIQPIPTGLCIIREDLNNVYQDAVCPNPGCYYKLPGGVATGIGADDANCGAAALGTCGPP
jgi:hypothetical protein